MGHGGLQNCYYTIGNAIEPREGHILGTHALWETKRDDRPQIGNDKQTVCVRCVVMFVLGNELGYRHTFQGVVSL